MSSASSSASCKKDAGTFFSTFGMGIAGMFGFGGIYDPMSNARADVQKAQANLNAVTTKSTLVVATLQAKVTAALAKEIETMQNWTGALMEYNTSLLWGSINSNSIITGFIAMILTVLIIFFLMISWLRVA